jgi:hypothetical protein
MISRPEALAFAGREIVITPARRKPPACPGPGCPTQMAEASPPTPAKLPPSLAMMFAPQPLADAPAARISTDATVPGSARILATNFALATFEVAARP